MKKSIVAPLLLMFCFLIHSRAWGTRYIACKKEDKTCSCNDGEHRFEVPFAKGASSKGLKAYECRSNKILIDISNKSLAPEQCQDQEVESIATSLQNEFPSLCGYSISKFKMSDLIDNIKNILESRPINCTSSMCTSATFLFFVRQLQILHKAGKITAEQLSEWTNINKKPYKYHTMQARPDLLMTTTNLGKGKILRSPNFPTDEWPKEGDLLQLWRNNQSGHSTVYTGPLKDAKGKTIALCYWSSNPATQGYGTFCEDVTRINRIIIGRIEK